MTKIQSILVLIRARFARRRKLARIVSSFDKTVRDLRTLRRQHNAAISKNYNRIAKIRATNAQLDHEASRADSIADNIERLLG